MWILFIVCEINDITIILVLSPVWLLFFHLSLEVTELSIQALLKGQEMCLSSGVRIIMTKEPVVFSDVLGYG